MNLPGVVLMLAIAQAEAPSPASIQQIADSTFHVTVARPAFAEEPLRVMFDEVHHNFHTLEGRYRPFAELLEQDGCVLASGTEAFTQPFLSGFDLVVIANAMGDDPGVGTAATVSRPAFTREEIEAVHGWVEAGGRLLLIAGHTPFGEAAACLAERFGVDMGRGYTLDRTLMLAGQESPFVMDFTRESGTLGDHPILDGREASETIARVIAFTGQSLRGPRESTPLLLLSPDALDLPAAAQAAAEDVEEIRRQALPAAGRSVAVALVAGRGRVVVVGEPGMLTAEIVSEPDREPQRIGMNVAGTDNPQFVLNIVRWLAGVLPERPPAGDGAANIVSVASDSSPETAAPPPTVPTATGGLPDFSGSWHLTAQETEAWRGKGSIGNYEEPVRIAQTATQLFVEVLSPDPAGRFEYDLTGGRHERTHPEAGKLWSSSAWDGARLVTTGRRLFKTPDGPKAFEFEEERELIDGGHGLRVRMRIEMWPSDLVRTSAYARGL
ncbi:MAG: hypothetical protein ACKVU1_06730 [bacterium]